MIIGNYLKSNKKVMIAEKPRSKNKPALEVQWLLNKPFGRIYHCNHYVKIHDSSFITFLTYILKILGKSNKFSLI